MYLFVCIALSLQPRRGVTKDKFKHNNIIKEIAYDTYGNILSDTNQDFKVPFGFAGGDTNLYGYGYGLGDPVNFVDPEGLMSRKPIIEVDYDYVRGQFCMEGFAKAIYICSTYLGNANTECRTYVAMLETGLEPASCHTKEDEECKVK